MIDLSQYKTKEKFNSCDWSDYYEHKYIAVKVKGICYYKF